MRCGVKWLMIGLVLLVASAVSAANWPQLDSRLQQWQGDKEVSLPAGVDPFDDPVLAPVVELLLEQGFAVLPAAAPAKAGLVVELRTTSRGRMLLLKRAGDNALLAMEKLEAAPTQSSAPVVLSTPKRSASAEVIVPTPAMTTTSVLSVKHRSQPAVAGELLFELDGTPLQVVAWPATDGGLDLYLMYDRYLQRVHSDGHSLQLRERFTPPRQVSRALHLEIGDLNNDGQPELAAVWAEDVRGVSDGTNTLLHSWVLTVDDQDIRAISEDLEGYVSLADGQGRLQRRSEYASFTPDVYPLTLNDGAIVVGDEAVAHDARLLFNQLQWPDSRSALVWNDEQRLMLVARAKNTRIPGSTLLTDFGQYHGPIVSIPLQTPEYRSGFAADDQVLAREVSLARRLVRRGGAVFTLVRGRSAGLPLVGRASGVDRLVAIHNSGNTLQASYPFAAVEAFIIDFSLYGDDGVQAVLLLNEKSDGSGSSYLRLQQSL